MKNKTNKEIGPFNLTPIEIKFVVNQFYKKFENKTITESIAKLYNIESKNISYLSQDFLQENLNYKVEIAKQLKIIQLIPILQGQNGASNRQCSQQKRDMYIDSQENISDHLKISLPAIPQNLVKMKKQTLIADVNIKPLKFDVIEILYDDFFQFASKHASKNRIYLHNLVYLWNNSPFYFNQIRKINNILILNYEATVNQDCNNDNRNDIQYRNLSDLLQDLDKFLLLRELSVVIFR